ncbi:hypothetical protein QH639_19555 [Lysinibacillus sp. 1 U-2021]|nr:hypothetical protein [Lysinibacillus sp. 1 U-2021]WGT38000.1 hypothetical protein QH639_19555 [Lysinibacillus sp. 1 U-2021]
MPSLEGNFFEGVTTSKSYYKGIGTMMNYVLKRKVSLMDNDIVYVI